MRSGAHFCATQQVSNRVDDTGKWTKYLHDDVKRVGNVGSAGGAQPHFHHRDHLKSIKLVTDASGAEVRRVTYAPLGREAVATGPHTESKGWIGQRKDAETGCRNRLPIPQRPVL